jgi:hypothetical protein
MRLVQCTNLLRNNAAKLMVVLPVCQRTTKMPENILFQEMMVLTFCLTGSCFFLEGCWQKRKLLGIKMEHFNQNLTVIPFGFVEGLNWWVFGKTKKIAICRLGRMMRCLYFALYDTYSYTSIFEEFEVGFFFLPKTSYAILLPMTFSRWNTVTVPI